MKEFLDSARSVVKERYAFLTPGGFVPSSLPGWEKALCQVLICPALGARFSQLLITLQSDSLCQGNTGRNQYCLYVLEGSASILSDNRRHRLEPGSCAYVPPGKDVQLLSAGPAARILIFQKEYHPLPGTANPPSFVIHEREVKAQPLPGHQAARLQVLLPAEPAFDMAVNLLTFQPGAGLPAVAAHVMEHGFMMLRGQGIFRLNTDWHPAQAGDVIWTAAYCPQWFAALGNTPASYICYQDVNRDPM